METGLMEIRPSVEQHFGSELVDIEVEIGFMETRLNKQNEREKQPNRTSPFSLTFFVKLVAKQTKGKMIVINCVIKKSQHSFYELFRSPFTFGMYPQRYYKTGDNCIFSTFKVLWVSVIRAPDHMTPKTPTLRS